MQIDKPFRIFGEAIDPAALKQFESAMRQSFVVRGALMPDAHVGYSLPIGAVVATREVIVPAWVGYDIGCGMCALPTTFAAKEVRKHASAIFEAIYRAVPVGFAHNGSDTPWPAGELLPRSSWLRRRFGEDGLRQLGSLGSGNHFAEIGADETGRVWIVIHSGSRGIGHDTAAHYMRLAACSSMAEEGHHSLSTHSIEGRAYIEDLAFCLAFALENRQEMMRRIVASIAGHVRGDGLWRELINRNHNHAELKDGLWIHRKGATHAEAGMPGVIPGNMRDGSFIVRGKGNPESLCSSSHGAGRRLGRREAKRHLHLHDFAAAMQGIAARVGGATLDEAPAAYKDIFAVMALQRDLVEVVAHVRPMVNIKG